MKLHICVCVCACKCVTMFGGVLFPPFKDLQMMIISCKLQMRYIYLYFTALEAEVTHRVVHSLLCVVAIVSNLANHGQVFFEAESTTMVIQLLPLIFLLL